MRFFKTTNVIAILALLILSGALYGQMPNSLFFMPGVPQAHRINPATQPGAGFYLGFPALSPLRLQFTSSALSANDLLIPNAANDGFITPLHPDADKDAFLNNFKDVNYFMTNVGTSLASVGFRARKSYISFDIITRVENALYYPKGIFELAFNGAADNSEISLEGLGMDMTVFNEFSMGWSRKDFFIKNLDIGIRGKALLGLANIDTKESDFTIQTSQEAWNLNTAFAISAAAPPIVQFNTDLEDEPVSVNDALLDLDNLSLSTVKEIMGLNQSGLALDIGVNYRLFDKLLLSASALDLGGIRWKNTMEGEYNFAWDFEGVEANPFTGIDTTFISALEDSLLNSYSISAGSPYYSKLNPKLYFGASYYPIEKIGFGFVSKTVFLDQRTSQEFTGTVNMTTGKFINLTLSYSYIAQQFNNVGAGLSLNLGPLNLYLISDNVVSAALNPFTTRSMNLWFGLNTTFSWQKVGGSNRGKKANEKFRDMDKPMIY